MVMRVPRFSNGFAVCFSTLGVLSVAVLSTWTTARPPVSAKARAIVPLTPASAVSQRAAPQSGPGRPAERSSTPGGSRGMPRPAPAIVRASADQAQSAPEPSLAFSRQSAGGSRQDVVITPEPNDHDVPHFMICHLDARGPFGAADVLQECLDRAPAFSSVEIPPGTYVLHRQVVVSTPLTIRTAGSANTSLSCVAGPDQCAILMAAPELLESYGFLFIGRTNNATLEHLVLDGNRAARVSSTAALWCLSRNNSFGYNASVIECVSCSLDDVVSKNALCGSGMVWSGARAAIRRSEFRANGDATRAGMWADGLTLAYAPESEILQNRFVDNSDVALIIGYGVRSRVEGNLVVQRTQAAFAGLMLDNFNSDNLSFRGDFRGAVIADNTVDCGPQLCVFGIQVGPRPWYFSKNIVGGELHGNKVRGAKVGINVNGGGTFRAPIAIFANAVSDVPAGSYFSDCARAIPTDWMNVAPTSVVDRRDELSPTGVHLSDPCQLSSALAPDAR